MVNFIISSQPTQTQRPPENCKAPLLKTSWRRFWVRIRLGSYGLRKTKTLAQPRSGFFVFPQEKYFHVNIFAWNLVGCCKTLGKPVLQFQMFRVHWNDIITFLFSESTPSKNFEFLITFAKGGHNWQFLHGNFISNVFIFSCKVFWIKTTEFCGNVKNGFSQTIMSQWRQKHA